MKKIAIVGAGQSGLQLGLACWPRAIRSRY